MAYVTAFQPGAFQANAFQIFGGSPPAPEPYHQPGGGYYRPIIYLDEDGKPTTLDERRKRREAQVEAEQLLHLSPEIIQALAAQMPGLDPAQLMAMLESAERQMLWSQFDRASMALRAAEEEEALALLLLTTI